MGYYYLISGLPDLSPDMDAGQIDYEKTFELIRRNLTPDDNKVLDYLIYPHDIRNFLSVLFEEYHDLEKPDFVRPSVLSEDKLSSYKLSKKNFPDFISDFLMENEDRFQAMSMRQMEDGLMANFYEEALGISNDFTNEYYSFYQKLKATIAAFNFNAHDFLSRPSDSDTDRLIGQIGPSRTPTSSVMRDYPYLEALIEKMSGDEPKGMEKYIDRILWDFLEEIEKGFFDAEEVFAYTVKLLMKQRWDKLDTEKGSELFDEYHEKIKNNVRSPKTPVI